MIPENMKDEIYKKKKKKKKKSNSEIRTTDVTTKNTTPITARPHHTLKNTAQNKECEKLQMSSRVLTRFSRVFLNSGWYAFVIYLLHRETLISRSFKKSVTQSPCTLLVSK